MFGKKYQIIYDKNGRIVQTREVGLKVPVKNYPLPKDLKPVQIKPPKEPKPQGIPRSITIAMKMIEDGISNWPAIEASIVNAYKTETNRQDNYIRKSCSEAREYLVKQGLL